MSWADAREHRADNEDDDATDEEHLASVDVGQLADDRYDGRGGDQISGGYPGKAVEATEVSDDMRDGGCDDGLVE